MDAGLIEGALLGAAVGELVNLVKKVRTRCSVFKSTLEDLEKKLNLMSPIIEETEKLSSNSMEPLLDLLKTGKELVLKCSNISEWDIKKKTKMSRQLMEFKQQMFELFVVYQTAMTTRNTFKILEDLCYNFGRSPDDCNSVLKGNNLQGLTNNTLLDSWEVFDGRLSTVGLDQPLKELKTMLLQSEQVVHVLSAPGGCGKTTLAKALCKDDDVKGKFGTNIFAVTVTKTPNLMVIIQTLLNQMNIQAWDFKSDTEALFIHFENSMKKILKRHGGSVLCILDDVWSGSESKYLLEKFELKIQGYKVLITSRYVFPRFAETTYRLKLLSDADASTLFRHSAFPQNDTSISIRDEVVNEIVRKCKNNPLALKVIGRSLRGEPEEEWKSRNKKWSKYVFGTENEVNELLDSLGASLDALGENGVLKDCFLDLASFPEDSTINVPALVDMWMELYKLDSEEDAMCRINNLFNRCLVDLVIKRKGGRDRYGYYNDRFITQHDILRELAIHRSMQEPVEQRRRFIIEISGEDRYPEWLTKLENQTFQARLVSISTDENFTSKSKWRDLDIELSRVEVLVLNLSSEDYGLPKFIEKMGELKVLVITNHGIWPTKLSNFLILGSLFNLRRIRLEKVSIPSIFESSIHHEPVGNVINPWVFLPRFVSFLNNYRFRAVTPMKSLKKISLVMCSIGEAFNNCSAQLSEILPELEEIDVDYCNDLIELPSQLCDLRHLTKLSITNCPKLKQLPDRIGVLGKTLLILSLHACIELSTLPDSISSLHNLTILDISECLSLGNLPEKMGDMIDLEELHMKGCINLSKLPASIFCLPHLKNVYCDEETACLWTYCDEEMHVKVNVSPETVNLKWLGLGGLH